MELETCQTDFEDLPEELGVFSVLGPEGDTKHIWNPKREEEIEAARLLFDTLTSKGYRAFKLTRLGTKGKLVQDFDLDAKGRLLFTAPKAMNEDGEMLTNFDPSASRVIFTRPMAGG